MTGCSAFKFWFQIQFSPLHRGRGHAGDYAGAVERGDAGGGGKAIQFERMKPMLKALKAKRLNLKCDNPLSSFDLGDEGGGDGAVQVGTYENHDEGVCSRVYTGPLLSST